MTVLDEVEKSKIIAEWFADTWLLVVENDADMWGNLVLDAKGKTLTELSELLREEYESVVEQTIDYVDAKNSFSWFLREFLQGWGSAPFDIISQRILERIKEIDSHATR